MDDDKTHAFAVSLFDFTLCNVTTHPPVFGLWLPPRQYPTRADRKSVDAILRSHHGIEDRPGRSASRASALQRQRKEPSIP